MKKLILISLTSLLLSPIANGQTLVNNGAIFAVTPGGVMSVKTDGINVGSGSFENLASNTGIFRNAGFVEIEGSFVNTSGVADGFGTNTGVYKVQGDWDNNASFTADSSTVILYGPAQAIKGSNATAFYNLIDTLPASVKTQQIDASVAGIFTLYNCEHATANYYLNILNPSPTAIVENTYLDAFVSSTGNGRLLWNTNQKAEYIFPTGINENGPKIREVSITPPNSTPRTYSVRFADYAGSSNTTTTDGYDTAQKSGYISKVNDVYYHLVNAHGNTDPADLAIYFDPTVDPAWQSIARWQVVPQWQDLQNTALLADARGAPRYKIVKSAWLPTNDTAFALVDTIAVKADFAFPSAFVGDGQGIPNANTYFGIINQAGLVTLKELSVFNRWGEMVFDSNRDGNQNWNGHFNGKLQPQGNYVYRAVVVNNSTGKQYPLVTGNVALLW